MESTTYELSSLSQRRPSQTARPSAFQITPIDHGDEEASAAATSFDANPARRTSRSGSDSGALRSTFGFTPITTDDIEDAIVLDDETTGVSTAIQESFTKRRQSRSESFRAAQPPPIAIPTFTPTLTPPADGPDDVDPFAPKPGVSLPPTPMSERTFDLAGHVELGTPEETTQDFFSSLPPTDGGRGAYLFLLSATTLEAAIWGLPYSVGVLHEYWTATLFADTDSETMLTLASTLPTGLLFFSGALLGPVFTMFPWYERHIQWGGVVLSSLGLLTSAFATKPWHLLLTFGILYPFSGATYLPLPTNIFEWFQARRGLATGILYAGTGLGGTVYPFVVTALLNKFGYKATMIALAISFFVINVIALPFAKRRLPLAARPSGKSERTHTKPKINWSFLRGRAIWVAVVYQIVTSLANFIPLLWIPSYAASIGAKKPDGAAIVAIMNAITIPGQMLSGYISDRMSTRMAVVAATTIAAVSCVTLWGFGTSEGLLVTFAVVWGLTGGSMAGYWGKMITIIARDDPAVPVIAFSAFISLKGIGSLTSGPISTALLGYDAFRGAAGAYGSTNYGVLLIYTAVMTFVGGLAMFAFPKK